MAIVTHVHVMWPRRFKTQAAFFTVLRDERFGMQTGNFGQERYWSSFVIIRSDSESIFQLQFYYNKSLMTILGLAGVLFPENEHT